MGLSQSLQSGGKNSVTDPLSSPTFQQSNASSMIIYPHWTENNEDAISQPLNLYITTTESVYHNH
jgi:hypothetical protein